MTTTPTRPVPEIEFRRIAVGDIVAHEGNPRTRFKDIEELAASIIEVGLIEPIVVERLPPAGYKLLAGERRLRAARLANIRTLPAIIRPAVADPIEATALMLIENGQRSSLDPIEEARGYARLVGMGLNQGDVARRVGRSQTHVSMRLMLLNLSPEEQEKVRTGELLVRDAREDARRIAGTHRQTKYTGWHLGKTHQLAERVRDTCHDLKHPHQRRIGAIGCGMCWEQVIRADEREALRLSDAVPTAAERTVAR